MKVNKPAIIKALKELGRLVVLSLPALAIQIISGNPDLTLQYGGTILFLLKGIDQYIHKNPSINANGLLPF